jgi:hypothetical protein
MNTIIGKNLRDGSKVYREQLITIEDLEVFKADLLSEIRKLLQPGTTQSGRKEWLRSSEVRKMLGISPGTLQNLRVTGKLPFTKIGAITFYRSEDISKLLASNSQNT